MSNHNMPCKYKRHAKKVLWVEQDQKCAICGKQLPGERESSLDHKIPFSISLDNGISNLQLVHLKCNNLKADKIGFKVNA